MRNLLIRTSALFLLIVSLAVLGLAQNRQRFGISAKAGAVNAISGNVKIKRAGQDPQLLTSNDDIGSGETVTTGSGGQAEILLNPGTYLRLDEKTEFVMVDNSLDKLLVRLNSGSAIIEATGMDGVQLRIPVQTAQQNFTIARAGIYRINAAPGRTELFVRKGRVWLGDDPQNVVKSGKKIIFTGGQPSIAKVEKNDQDSFDDWSKTRGKTLARANQSLSSRLVNGYLSTPSWGWASTRYVRWGLWTWSPGISSYTFLPFRYGWCSPYGGVYGNYAGGNYYYPGSIRPGYYNPPVIVTNNPPSQTGPLPSAPSSGPTGGGFGSGGAGPISSPPSAPTQAGPRDPDSGSRGLNRVKDPD
jgi:hypothetical protein